MKKILYILIAFMIPALGYAQTDTKVADQYVGTFSLIIDGLRYDHDNITMYVEKSGETVNLSINEFKLVRDGVTKQIGNIRLSNVRLTPAEYPSTAVNMSLSQTVTITQPTTPVDPDNPNGVEGSNQQGSPGFGNNEGEEGGGPETDYEWYGPSYGEMNVTMDGSAATDFISLSFRVFIPNLEKYVEATFTMGNVPTRIAPIKVAGAKNIKCYTPAGIPVSSSYKGIVVSLRTK